MFNCEHCHLSPETICHALWECPKITEVWEAILGFEFRQLHNFPWFRDLVLFIQAEGKNLELLTMVLWTIWYRRNQLRVGSKDFPISQVGPQASHALSDIKQFNVSLPSWQDGISNSWAWSQWLPPPRDYFKINFNGATFPELGNAGLGLVIRDWRGNVVASLSEKAPLPFSLDIVEAMAIASAISFCSWAQHQTLYPRRRFRSRDQHS